MCLHARAVADMYRNLLAPRFPTFIIAAVHIKRRWLDDEPLLPIWVVIT